MDDIKKNVWSTFVGNEACVIILAIILLRRFYLMIVGRMVKGKGV